MQTSIDVWLEIWDWFTTGLSNVINNKRMVISESLITVNA